MNLKPVVNLRSWSTTSSDVRNPYIAPECVTTHLQGICYGHPNIPDGKRIITSPIIKVNGPEIETKNSLYILVGPPDPLFVLYCEQIGYKLDLANPIKVKNVELPVQG